MELNTDTSTTQEQGVRSGSLTTISIKIINPPMSEDGVTAGKIAAIATGTAGTPPWPVAVQMTYFYNGVAIDPANLGTYFNPIPPVSVSLPKPSYYSPYADWNVASGYSSDSFTVQGSGEGTNGIVQSPIHPMATHHGEDE